MKWKLYGPYANKGILRARFPPEEKSFKAEKKKYQALTGGTIILRHFWYPEVKAVYRCHATVQLITQLPIFGAPVIPPL